MGTRFTLLVAVFVACAAAAAATAVDEEHPALANHTWQVIAHQGGNHLRPGDTMLAFRNAVDLGVDVLEMDVHSTADGVLVVIHDRTVDRTTNGEGRVSDLTFDEIRTLDAAYHWPFGDDEGDRPFRGTGVTIPSLEEVLTAFPDMPMIIEIKQADPPIVETFGRMLVEHDRAGNTIVASFHAETMHAFRERFPQFATSGVQPEIVRFFVLSKILLGAAFRPEMEVFQVPESFGRLRVVRPRFVRVAHRRGITTQVWTVNEADDMERLLEVGVDGIMTDRPDLLLEVLGR
jgi:glycerophosphoryl diester phosphodiesterase